MMEKNNNYIQKIYSKRSIERVDRKIKLLGVNNKLSTVLFLNIRLVASLTIFSLLIIFVKKGYLYAPIITLIYYYGLEYIQLDSKIKKRASKLDYEALLFFEVLSLSITTGRDLKAALEQTIANIDSGISDEFKYVIKEMNYGKSMSEAINNAKLRIPSDTINNVLLNISQTSTFGTNIVDTLNTQVDYLREKKLLEVRSSIAKMPIKISIVSVLFFVPLILLMILSPLIINFFN